MSQSPHEAQATVASHYEDEIHRNDASQHRAGTQAMCASQRTSEAQNPSVSQGQFETHCEHASPDAGQEDRGVMVRGVRKMGKVYHVKSLREAAKIILGIGDEELDQLIREINELKAKAGQPPLPIPSSKDLEEAEEG